jgi:hypothetical protein
MKLKIFPVVALAFVLLMGGSYFWWSKSTSASDDSGLIQFDSKIGRVYLYPTGENNNDVFMTLLVHAGSWHNTGTAGHAHFLEHLVWHRANLSNGSGQIMPALTWPTYTIYDILTSNFILPGELQRLTTLLEPVVELPDRAVEEQRDNIIWEFEHRYLKTQHTPTSYKAAQDALLEGTSLLVDHMASRPDTEILTAKDADAFRAEFYTPENVSIVISGEVTKQEVLDVFGAPPVPLARTPNFDPSGQFDGKKRFRQTAQTGGSGWTGVSLSHFFEVPDCGAPENCDALSYLALFIAETAARIIYDEQFDHAPMINTDVDLLLDRVASLSVHIELKNEQESEKLEAALASRFHDVAIEILEPSIVMTARTTMREIFAPDSFDFIDQHGFFTTQLSRRNQTPYSNQRILEAIDEVSIEELRSWFIQARDSGNALITIIKN